MHSNHFGTERILCNQHRDSLSELYIIFGFGAVCLSTAGQYIFHKGTTEWTSAENKRKEKKNKREMRQKTQWHMKTLRDETKRNAMRWGKITKLKKRREKMRWDEMKEDKPKEIKWDKIRDKNETRQGETEKMRCNEMREENRRDEII